MKKNSFSLFGYIFGGLLFFVWILFLFFDAKKEALFSPIDAQLPVGSEVVQEHLLGSEGSNQVAETLSGFLQQEESLSVQQLQTLGGIKEKIAYLEQFFDQQQSSELANLLLEAYQLDKQFDTAKKFYLSLPEKMKADLDQTLDFKLGIQTFSQTSAAEYQNLKALLEQKYEQKLFSSLERKYYAVAFALADQRYDSAKAGMQELLGTKYEDFVRSIQSAFDHYATLKDVPSYYQDALIAYQLMNEGFFALAKKIALPLVNHYPNYILPYQILANVDFLMGKRSSAARYFSQLLELDYQEKNLYLYHLGVAYYRLQQFSDAVLYLAQISDPSILFDSDRYLILSYLALGEEERVFAGRQRLLGYPSIKKSDFYSFFEEALWKPYRLGKSSPYLKKKEKLVQSYLLSCTKKLSGSDAEVCQYGEMGLAAQQGKFSELEVQVSRLARKYPKSELFLLLAQIAEKKSDEKEATVSLMRALSLTKSSEEKTYLKEQILRLNKGE